MVQLGPGPLGPEGGAETLEYPQCSLQTPFSEAFAAGAAMASACDQQRAGLLERQRQALMDLQSVGECSLGPGRVTRSSEEKSPAAPGGGDSPPPAQLDRPGLERVEQPGGGVEVPKTDECFD